MISKGTKVKLSLMLIVALTVSIGSGTIFSQGTFSETFHDSQKTTQQEGALTDVQEQENSRAVQQVDAVKNQQEPVTEREEQQPLQREAVAAAAEDNAVTPAREDYEINGTTLQHLKVSYIENLTAEQKQNIHVVIPSGINCIDAHAFDTSYLGFSNNIFRECRFISLDLSQATELKEIGSYAFNGCSSMVGDLILPQRVETISSYAFHNAGFNGTLVMPNTLTTIGANAFRQGELYQGLQGDIVLPEKLTTLGAAAFSGQKAITGVVLPINLTALPDSVFRNTGLCGVLTIPENIRSIGKNTFSGTALQSVYLPAGITIVDGAFDTSQSPYVICKDKAEYERLTSVHTKFKITYETMVRFEDGKSGVYDTIKRLYNQPYNVMKQDNGCWETNAAYTFPSVQYDERMKWAAAADGVAEIKVTDTVETDTLYAALIYEDPKATYSNDIDKVYDGNDIALSVKAEHPYASTLDKAKEGDVVFYYWWNWETISQVEYILKGWGEDTYKFHDIRAPFAISCRVTVQAYRIKNNKTTLFYTTRHSFKVDVRPSQSSVHPQFDKDCDLDTGLPDIRLQDGDTPGTLRWDEGQNPQLGTHSYTWTFTPEKNAEGQYNYKEAKGTADITFNRYQAMHIQKTAHGQIQADTKKPVQGRNVVLTFVPEKGYHLTSVQINKAEYVEEVKNNRLSLLVQEDLDIQAVFEKIKAADIQEDVAKLPQTTEPLNKEQQQTVLEILSEYTQMDDESAQLDDKVKEELLEAMQRHPQIIFEMDQQQIHASSLTSLLDEVKHDDIFCLQEEARAKLRIHMDVRETANSDDRSFLEKQVKRDGLTLASCYDVKLLKTLTADAEERTAEVRQLSKPILLTFALPQKLTAPDGVNREFYILRIHENADGTQRIDLLEPVQREEDEISVYSDRFSAYAIAYRDSLIQTNEDPDNALEAQKEAYVITAEKNGQGTITPQGAIQIKAGAQAVFTFVPAQGYHVQDVLVDGKSQGRLNSYTFPAVDKNHTIQVTFEKDAAKAENIKHEQTTASTEQTSPHEKSQTAADTFDSARNEHWILAGLVSVLALLCIGIRRFNRK